MGADTQRGADAVHIEEVASGGDHQMNALIIQCTQGLGREVIDGVAGVKQGAVEVGSDKLIHVSNLTGKRGIAL
ncbi:hypothetical protein THUN1379_03860 [Paludibacterium sp. THUN1379]|nr:hypothetical protein THUN1379_03860 [Paludibacterium sp. THUN1379]